MATTVRTSEEARDMLRAFSDKHSVPISALIEVFARRLPTGDDLTPFQQALLDEARDIAADSRRRG